MDINVNYNDRNEVDWILVNGRPINSINIDKAMKIIHKAVFWNKLMWIGLFIMWSILIPVFVLSGKEILPLWASLLIGLTGACFWVIPVGCNMFLQIKLMELN